MLAFILLLLSSSSFAPTSALTFCGPTFSLLAGGKQCPSPGQLKTLEGQEVCCGYDQQISGYTPIGRKIDASSKGEFCGPYAVVDGIPRCPVTHPYDGAKSGKDRCCGNKPITADQQRDQSRRISSGATGCVDLAAAGRPSDCPASKHLCDDPVWRDLMTQQCPKTCGRCGQRADSSRTACRDGVGPNGVSDCPANKARCKEALWKAFMERECPLTCGVCARTRRTGTTRDSGKRTTIPVNPTVPTPTAPPLPPSST